MAKKIYNCADAVQFLKNKDNNSDIVFITISKYVKTQQGYDELLDKSQELVDYICQQLTINKFKLWLIQ
jgi:hypothetical protein